MWRSTQMGSRVRCRAQACSPSLLLPRGGEAPRRFNEAALVLNQAWPCRRRRGGKVGSWVRSLVLGTGLLGARGRAATPGLHFPGRPRPGGIGSESSQATPAEPGRRPGPPWGVEGARRPPSLCPTVVCPAAEISCAAGVDGPRGDQALIAKWRLTGGVWPGAPVHELLGQQFSAWRTDPGVGGPGPRG